MTELEYGFFQESLSSHSPMFVIRSLTLEYGVPGIYAGSLTLSLAGSTVCGVRLCERDPAYMPGTRRSHSVKKFRFHPRPR